MEKTSNAAETGKTRWHRILGRLLEGLLPPVGVLVFTDYALMSESPKTDILLLENKGRRWTKRQKERLPDGVRDAKAGRILIEFKYSESVGKSAFAQTVGYDWFYKRAQGFKDHEVETFLISARTPRRNTLETFGYGPTENTGVYRSAHPLLDHIGLLALNELSDAPHNAFIKCFASRQKEKNSAFAVLRKQFNQLDNDVRWVLEGLMRHWLVVKGGLDMEAELTPEKVVELGKQFERAILESLTAEDFLEVMKPEDFLKVMKPEDILKALTTEDRLKGLGPEDRLKGLGPEELKAVKSYIEKIENSSGAD